MQSAAVVRKFIDQSRAMGSLHGTLRALRWQHIGPALQKLLGLLTGKLLFGRLPERRTLDDENYHSVAARMCEKQPREEIRQIL